MNGQCQFGEDADDGGTGNDTAGADSGETPSLVVWSYPDGSNIDQLILGRGFGQFDFKDSLHFVFNNQPTGQQTSLYVSDFKSIGDLKFEGFYRTMQHLDRCRYVNAFEGFGQFRNHDVTCLQDTVSLQSLVIQ